MTNIFWSVGAVYKDIRTWFRKKFISFWWFQEFNSNTCSTFQLSHPSPSKRQQCQHFGSDSQPNPQTRWCNTWTFPNWMVLIFKILSASLSFNYWEYMIINMNLNMKKKIFESISIIIIIINIAVYHMQQLYNKKGG